MATVLQGRHGGDQEEASGEGGPAFAEVFVIVWLGSMVVTLNTKLLGGHISFFQSVCVLGEGRHQGGPDWTNWAICYLGTF
jgi:hypothetical protein